MICGVVDAHTLPSLVLEYKSTTAELQSHLCTGRPYNRDPRPSCVRSLLLVICETLSLPGFLALQIDSRHVFGHP